MRKRVSARTTDALPPALATWCEAPRVRPINSAPLNAPAKYVLCWLQQALRGVDNPVIDAAVLLGNAVGLPVLVYHGVREDYPYASDRLHAFKRLRTLQAFDRLGAGFAISARDLDMRGAGDLIGDEQAGHRKLIGVALYQHLLESALRQARGETVERWTPEINLRLSGRLSETWIPEPEIRVALYARMARAETAESIDALEEELADRFGALPAEAETLLAVARIRALARAARVARVDAGPVAIALTPRGDLQSKPISGLEEKAGRLIAAERIEDAQIRLQRVGTLLEQMIPED